MLAVNWQRALVSIGFVLLAQFSACAIEQVNLAGTWNGVWGTSDPMTFTVNSSGQITGGSCLGATLSGQLNAAGGSVTGNIKFDVFTVFNVNLVATQPGQSGTQWRIAGPATFVGLPVVINMDVSGGSGTPPDVTGLGTVMIYNSVPFAYTATATGDTPMTFTITGALPPGLSVSGNGIITGTPTTLGSFNVTVNATNAWGGSQKAVTFKVIALPPGSTAGTPPPFTSITSPLSASVNPAAPGQDVVFTVGASRNDGGTVFYFWNFGDGTVTAGGASITHAYATEGPYNVVVSCGDGQGHDSTSELLLRVTGPYLKDVGEIKPVKGRVKFTFPLPASMATERRVKATVVSSTLGPGLKVRGLNLTGKTFTAGTFEVVLELSTKSGQVQRVKYTYRIVL